MHIQTARKKVSDGVCEDWEKGILALIPSAGPIPIQGNRRISKTEEGKERKIAVSSAGRSEIISCK